MLVPIYQEQGRTYEADSCQPVVDATAREQIRLVHLARGHYPGRRLPRTALPGVMTIGYWDADRQQDWGLDYHRNEGIELSFLKAGRWGSASTAKTANSKVGT